MEIENLMNELREETQDLDIDVNVFVGYNPTYICDIITDVADSNIDIYTSNLLNWAYENYNIIDDAIAEFGNAPDFLGYIKQGQFYAFSSCLYNNLDKYLLYYIYKYVENQGIDEISEEQNDSLINLSEKFNAGNKLIDVEIGIDNLIEEWKEVDTNVNTTL